VSVRWVGGCRGTSLVRNNPPIGPYIIPMTRDLGDPRGLGVSYERGTPVGVVVPHWASSVYDTRYLRVIHLWRDKWTALSGESGPLGAVQLSRHKCPTLSTWVMESGVGV
jgi:hypothetical protein